MDDSPYDLYFLNVTTPQQRIIYFWNGFHFFKKNFYFFLLLSFYDGIDFIFSQAPRYYFVQIIVMM